MVSFQVFKVRLLLGALCLLCCPDTVWGQGQNAISVENYCNDNFSCATGNTYKFLEKIQRKAYCFTVAGRKRLSTILDRIKLSDDLKDVDSINSIADDKDNRAALGIAQSALKKEMPTCFEDPLTNFLISNFVKQIEKACKQLNYSIKSRPIFGSLPTAEVNASTFPATQINGKKIGSILTFNTQLFMFSYQMTKITLPTVDVRRDSKTGHLWVNPSKISAIRLMEENPALLDNFNKAVLEFQQLVNPTTPKLDMKSAGMLMSITMAIELFAVAHEYGHLIKGHTGHGKRGLMLNTSNPSDHAEEMVVERAWKQELEADEIGIKLLKRALMNQIAEKTDPEEKHIDSARYLVKLYAPLFFFTCSDILEAANCIKKYDSLPSPLTAQQKKLLTKVADGDVAAAGTPELKGLELGSHPPGWLRAQKAMSIISREIGNEKLETETVKLGEIGLALNENIKTLWEMSLPHFPRYLDSIYRKIPPRKMRYKPSPALWDFTFRHNPYLIETINQFNREKPDDDSIVLAYLQALKSDWLLLSGRQVEWAKVKLKEGTEKYRNTALTIVAISGNIHLAQFLESINTSNWTVSDTLSRRKAIDFLKRRGRNTTSNALAILDPHKLSLLDLFSYPTGIAVDSINKYVPSSVSADFKEFLRGIRAVSIDGSMSLSPMALSMYANNFGVDDCFEFWADLLLKMKKADLAMQYVDAGLKKTDRGPKLENMAGNILTEKGELEKANVRYLKSLDDGRIDGWPEMNMARNYNKLGELANAELWFRKALDRKSTVRSVEEYAEYLNEFAWFLATKFKSDSVRGKEALKHSYISNELVKYSDPNYLDTLAECLFVNGDKKGAIEIMETILKVVPMDSPERKKYEQRLDDFKQN